MRLSVIMPSFNEEGSIEDAVKEIQQHVMTVVPDSELVVVDSSRDRTPEILGRLAVEDPRIRVLQQPPRGAGAAVIAGLEAASGEFLFQVDSDRQIPMDAFPPLWEEAQGADAAMGMRVQRHDPWTRLWLTVLVRHTIRLLFGTKIYDANVPFKIVRRSVWQQASPLITPDVLAPSLFLGIFLYACGFRVVQKETPHRQRQTGASIQSWKLFKACVRALGQLIAYRGRIRAWQREHASR